MLFKMKIIAVSVLSSIGLSSCGTVPGLGGKDYDRGQARTAQTVIYGTVTGIREVKIEGTRSGLGTGAGAITGGVLGAQVGHGRGRIVGGVLGALGGGIAGRAIEQQATKQTGVEIEVQTDQPKQQRLVVVQGADELFRIGDRVRVISGGGWPQSTRVTH